MTPPRADDDPGLDTYLLRILSAHRRTLALDVRDVSTEIERHLELAALRTNRRPFRQALVDAALVHGMAIIAEMKRRSPSRGILDIHLDPASLAQAYQAGGATCLSVLTDRDFFAGHRTDLILARAACDLPVLRKDFTLSPLDLCDALAMGADAVLLIVAALDDPTLASLLDLSRALHLDALVEVRSQLELTRAVNAGADLIGVNQRDLTSFDVDHRHAAALGALLPHDALGVVESGIRDATDVKAAHDAGFSAALVGESLLRATNRSAAVRALVDWDSPALPE